jgi:glutathionylspermidine synthase
MQRRSSQPRQDWRTTVESQGLNFHSPDDQTYWDESAYYSFAGTEIDAIEIATYALDKMCLAAVEHVIANNLFDQFQIPFLFRDYIKKSWDRDELTIVGRFDLAYDGHSPPKLLEYNADTPTSLLEAAVIQWNWHNDTRTGSDQFNSIHERLIEAWATLPKTEKLYLAGMSEDLEDFTTVTYLQDTATQAGLATAFIDIASIGWDQNRRLFVDETAQPIRRCFKLYPWEWLIAESFGPNVTIDTVRWLEAPWKMILSNKQILVVLSRLFPQSEYLLRASNQPTGNSYAKKPALSREGANVTLVRNGQITQQSDGPYDDSPVVYQELFNLPSFDGHHAVIGSWMVNGYACGIGIREDDSLITGNRSRFIPHVIE